MEYRNLGKSGLKVSALSFGSWVSFDRLLNESQALEIMEFAYDCGVNFFDNAEIYANGNSAQIKLGQKQLFGFKQSLFWTR